MNAWEKKKKRLEPVLRLRISKIVGKKPRMFVIYFMLSKTQLEGLISLWISDMNTSTSFLNYLYLNQ